MACCEDFDDSGLSSGCSGLGYRSHIYHHPPRNAVQAKFQLGINGQYSPTFNDATGAARVSFTSDTFSAKNLPNTTPGTGMYDGSVSGIWSTFPYTYLVSNTLCKGAYVVTIRDDDGPFVEFGVAAASGVKKFYTAHSDGVSARGYGGFGAPSCDRNNPDFFCSPYLLAGFGTTNDVDAFGYFRINPATLSSGVFTKNYQANLDFTRFGDTSSDASGKQVTLTGVPGGGGGIPVEYVTGTYNVTQFDGYLFNRLIAGTLDTPQRIWSKHSFFPFFNTFFYIYSEMENYSIAYGNPDEGWLHYSPYQSVESGVPYYNDAPVYFYSSDWFDGVPQEIGKVSDLLGGYQVNINLSCVSGTNSQGVVPMSGDVIIPTLAFSGSKTFNFQTQRCMYGRADVEAYGNMEYHYGGSEARREMHLNYFGALTGTNYIGEGVSIPYVVYYGEPQNSGMAGTYWSTANGDDWATHIDSTTETYCPITGIRDLDSGGEYPKSKGVTACIDRFRLDGDFSTAGLALKK
ncbi:MAG: hypothetical protein CMC15_15890, partial [Flavobacteriaceae bacterium]|nr:hypothetical protein [Flavobacteriaceae bacterium]